MLVVAAAGSELHHLARRKVQRFEPANPIAVALMVEHENIVIDVEGVFVLVAAGR